MQKMFVIALLAVAFCGISHAQAPSGYPNRPVKIIVTFAPGGPTDVGARLIGQKLSDSLKQRFYIENMPGAGGNIGTANAAKAPPDGYTILFAASPYVINPSLYAKIPYDPYNDFIPLTVVANAPNLLLTHPSLPAKNARELVDFLRTNTGKYAFASAGIGSGSHLASEVLKLTYKLDIVHAPFGGAGAAIQSVLAGHTPLAFLSLPSSEALIKDGRIHALAVTNKTRLPSLPNVPTMAEADMADQESGTFLAALVPAGTPKDIADLLYREIIEAVKSPDIAEKFTRLGFVTVANTPEQFAAQIKEEIAKWGKVIKEANIKAQ